MKKIDISKWDNTWLRKVRPMKTETPPPPPTTPPEPSPEPAQPPVPPPPAS